MFTPVLLATTVLVIYYALDISLKGLFVFFLINFNSWEIIWVIGESAHFIGEDQWKH